MRRHRTVCRMRATRGARIGLALIGASYIFLCPQSLTAQASAAPRQGTLANIALAAPVARWQLPAMMREASGLAVSGATTALVHGDEEGVLLEIDFQRGTALRVIRVGTPVLRGDFEGIVMQGSRVTLMTADGHVVTGVLHRTATRLDSVRTFRTGLQRECELEGLAVASDGQLLFPCKQSKHQSRAEALTVWAWSPETGTRRERPALSVAFSRLGRRLHPSEIMLTPAGTFVVLFGREHAIGEFTARGDVLTLLSLDSRRHPQPEGMALTADGRLLIADEATSLHPHATLTVYGTAR